MLSERLVNRRWADGFLVGLVLGLFLSAGLSWAAEQPHNTFNQARAIARVLLVGMECKTEYQGHGEGTHYGEGRTTCHLR